MAEQARRRHLLKLLGLGSAGVGLTAYSLNRGIRFPTLGWEPRAVASQIENETLKADLEQLIQTPSAGDAIHLRAYAPEPSLTLYAQQTTRIELSVNNIATDAELIQSNTKTIAGQINGITRTLQIDLQRGESTTLSWKLPVQKGFQFASIGDTGGHHELDWCIKRAHALGARFLIHLGDFNYQSGDYERSIELFKNSPIPCYVTIGNHDFHDDGHTYGRFLQEIGPLNSVFAIGATRFANIDTAANFLPYSAGHRGRLFEILKRSKDDYIDTVGFTHRPLHTPPEDDTHDIGSEAERNWLIGALNEANVPTLLSGHIHIYNQTELDGINNIIAGQGLGHQDLIVNGDHSKMVIGQVNDDGKVDYYTKPLAMPMNLHCHPRVDVVKQSLVDAPHYDAIERINQSCAKSTT